MAAKEGDIKPYYYKEKGHTWLHMTIEDHTRPHKVILGHLCIATIGHNATHGNSIP